MSAQTAIEILDSTFDNFKSMGSGISLDLQLIDITRRLQSLRRYVKWSADISFVAVKLRSNAAHYASHYRPHDGSDAIRKNNEHNLDEVVTQYSILRAHLLQQL